MRFGNSVIGQFIRGQENEDSKFIVLPWLFEVKKKIILVEKPNCLKDGNSSKQFIEKFNEFTGDKFDVQIKWLTQKEKTIFRVTDKSLHQACKIYNGLETHSKV